MPDPLDTDAPTIAAPLERAGERATSSEDAPVLFAGRYEILGLIGAGAMGTVYRARDRELDEIVALKMLKKELAAAPGMLERFKREVKLARRVTHKNVARTFDIGEHQGDRFLTMEFVDGEMLGARVARQGRLSVPEACAFARDVCEGLAAAHAAGVLHRDLKPENVIVAKDGHAVITDFGIARAVAQAELGRTLNGIVGTPAYMAPEQVEGAQDLDGRADLYSLGAMLFELLTGSLPWTGDTVLVIAAARLLKPPPDPRAYVPTLAAPVADLVLRLLARRREDRFASAEEAARALAEVEHLGEAQPRRSDAPRSAVPRNQGVTTVAVLPLVTLAGDADAYLAESVTEDLVDQLSMVPELRVRPRGETASYSRPDRDVREAGRTLRVDVIVDGSLRRFGDQVRIAVRLVTVEDGFQLWAKRFDRAPSDVLTVADVAGDAIAQALTSRIAATAHRTPPTDAGAQDLYLRGRHLLHRALYGSSQDALLLLREAAARAPDDPRILGTLALGLVRIVVNDAKPETARELRETAERALKADPDQPEARVALGLLHLANSEGAAAAVDLRRALELAPNAVDALEGLGRILVEIGRDEQGVGMLRKALSIEPEMIVCRPTIARSYALRGQWDAAYDQLGAEPPRPEHRFGYFITKARLLLWQGDKAAAQALRVQAATPPLATGRVSVDSLLEIAITGQVGEQARSMFEATLPTASRVTPRRATFNAQIRAEVHLACGETDQGIRMIQIADGHGLIDLAWLDHCPLLAAVRNRPEVELVRTNTAQRVARVLDALDN